MDAVVSPPELEQAIRNQQSRLRAAAYRILRDREEAEDAVQDGLLSAHVALPRFRGTAQLSTWLYRIVVNAALMRLRAHRRRPEQTLRWADLASSDAMLDALRMASSPEDRCAAREMVERVAGHIAALPAGQQQVLRMGVFEGLAHEEIALRTGETRDAVKLRLHRARGSLRRSVASEARGAAPRNRPARATSDTRAGTA